MQLTHLPREIVAVCNQPSEEAIATATLWCEDLRSGLEAQGDHFISDADAVRFENIQTVLAEVEAALYADAATLAGAGWPGDESRACSAKLSDAAYALIPLLERFSAERTRLHFVDVPAIDALLVAGVATLQGRGSAAAIAARIAGATGAVAAIERDFNARTWPGEIQGALERGLDYARHGLALVSHWDGDAATLEEGLRLLKVAGERLAFLPRWHREALDRMDPVGVPVIGTELSLLLSDPRDAFRATFTRSILPRLDAWWADSRDRLLLPLDSYAALCANTEDALLALRQAEDAEALHSAANLLAAAFSAMDGAALKTAVAQGTVLEPALDAVVGAWVGTVPDLVLAEVASRLADPSAPNRVREAATLIDAALQSGERALLLAAIESLLEAAQSLETPSLFELGVA